MNQHGATGLAWRTDLALLEQSGSLIENHGWHLTVRTSDNPAFYWGNFILITSDPSEHEGSWWIEQFEKTFPAAEHVAVGLDVPQVSLEHAKPLIELGLSADVSTVMTADRVSPGQPVSGVVLRTLTSDDDWDQRVALTQARYPDTGAGNAEFVRRRAASERARVEAGFGHCWGAFEDEALVSALGLFAAGDGLARFQDVQTHPNAERRGLASALIREASAAALDEADVDQLVMVADPAAAAAVLYRRLGFVDVEHQLELLRV